MHILRVSRLSPREAERKGLVHETVRGKTLDRAIEIARHLSSHTPESLAYIERLVRNATELPLAQGLDARDFGAHLPEGCDFWVASLPYVLIDCNSLLPLAKEWTDEKFRRMTVGT